MRKTLTAALIGTTALSAFANTAAARVDPQLTGAAKLAIPERVSKRGSESKYPFASLTEIGMAFGVKNKKASQLSSIVSNANRKNVVAVKDEAGNAVFNTKTVKDAAGNDIQVPDAASPKTEIKAHFIAYDVTPELAKSLKGTPLEGASAIVQRDQ